MDLLPKASGIYGVYNTVLDCYSYIGQAKNLRTRTKGLIKGFLNHESGTYRNYLLTEQISKYGHDNFRVDVLELVDIEQLNTREIYYIDYYNTFHLNNTSGCNLTPGGGGGALIGKHQTDYQRRMASIKQKGISRNVKEKNGLYHKKGINNGKETIFVTEEELTSYLNNGWNLGIIRRHTIRTMTCRKCNCKFETDNLARRYCDNCMVPRQKN